MSRTLVVFSLGLITGVYLAQNYYIPPIDQVLASVIDTFREVEQAFRKPRRPSDNELGDDLL
jgi:hypothetical protein